MKTKKCTKCGEEKPATPEFFHRQKLGKFGLRALCKVCVRNYDKKYYQENREHKKEYDKKYRQENREHYKKYYKKYHQENREQRIKNAKKWRQENREYHREYNKKWYQENLDKSRLHNRKRRHRKRQLDIKWNLKKETFVLKYFPYCAICGATEKLHIDHIYPLSKGHGLTIKNVSVLCQPCNSSKHNRWLFQLPYSSRSRINQQSLQIQEAWVDN